MAERRQNYAPMENQFSKSLKRGGYIPVQERAARSQYVRPLLKDEPFPRFKLVVECKDGNVSVGKIYIERKEGFADMSSNALEKRQAEIERLHFLAYDCPTAKNCRQIQRSLNAEQLFGAANFRNGNKRKEFRDAGRDVPKKVKRASEQKYRSVLELHNVEAAYSLQHAD